MTPVFLDTSGLIAAVNTRDQWHASARVVWADLMATKSPLVTTSLVLVELGDGLARIQHRQIAVAIRTRLLQSDLVDVVQVAAALEQEAWVLYASRLDKSWGLTDCASMIVMQQRGMRRVFSADKHFVQAGFEVLLEG